MSKSKLFERCKDVLKAELEEKTRKRSYTEGSTSPGYKRDSERTEKKQEYRPKLAILIPVDCHALNVVGVTGTDNAA